MAWTRITTALIFIADIITKRLAVNGLKTYRHENVWDGVLELHLSYNRGMAFGMFSGEQAIIVVLPVLVMFLGWMVMKKYHMTVFTRVAAGLLLGGFLGNFVERLFLGYVVDMIYFPFLPWFVCNIADISVSIGVALLLISLLFRPKDWREINAENPR